MRGRGLGSGRTIAPAIVRDLAESDEVESSCSSTSTLSRAETVANEHGGGKARGARRQAARDVRPCPSSSPMEVLVNSPSYRVNLAAMRVPGGACHYMDLGGLY